MKNCRMYDFVKAFTLVVLPGIGTFYFALAQLWNLPAAEEVVGTMIALDLLLGGIVKRSSSNYQKNAETAPISGEIVVTQNRDGDVKDMRFEALVDPFVPTEGQPIVFNVRREQL